jgi:NlpC/P60 family
MKIILRPNFQHFDIDRFFAIQEKILSTTYKKWSKNTDAPKYTDCITAIRYILQHSSDFIIPTCFIGDLPLSLIKNQLASIFPLSDAKIGDLIFFEKMSKTHKKYMVTHVWIMCNHREFIHSSLQYNGKISSIDDAQYIDNILCESFLPIAKDPRNYGN